MLEKHSIFGRHQLFSRKAQWESKHFLKQNSTNWSLTLTKEKKNAGAEPRKFWKEKFKMICSVEI